MGTWNQFLMRITNWYLRFLMRVNIPYWFVPVSSKLCYIFKWFYFILYIFHVQCLHVIIQNTQQIYIQNDHNVYNFIHYCAVLYYSISYKLLNVHHCISNYMALKQLIMYFAENLANYSLSWVPPQTDETSYHFDLMIYPESIYLGWCGGKLGWSGPIRMTLLWDHF